MFVFVLWDVRLKMVVLVVLELVLVVVGMVIRGFSLWFIGWLRLSGVLIKFMKLVLG